MSDKKKNKGGRPTDYDPKYNEQARKLCLMGYTDKELALFFEVSEQTLNTWKKKHPKFLESLKLGKDSADMEVAASLYQRAVGYSHRETKVFNNQGEIVTHDVTRIYPPDPISIKYWLNNRQKDKWREKVEEPEQEKQSQVEKIQIEVVNANSND